MSDVMVSTQVGLGDLLPLFEKTSLQVHVLPPLRRVYIPLDKYTSILMTEMQIGSWQVQLRCRRSKTPTSKILSSMNGHFETPEEALRFAESIAKAAQPDLVQDETVAPTAEPPNLAAYVDMELER